MSTKNVDILDFLEYYQQYPCLWDKSSPDYKNRQMRDEAERVLLELAGFENVKTLRAKIRSIRGTYNNELLKIKKSATTVSGADDIHKPKLHWFSNANSVLSKNFYYEPESQSNLVSTLIFTLKLVNHFSNVVLQSAPDLPLGQLGRGSGFAQDGTAVSEVWKN